MTSFLATAYGRNTSPELMAAVLQAAGGDENHAARIWTDSPTDAELSVIVEMVTVNGRLSTTDFSWGKYGGNWEAIFSA